MPNAADPPVPAPQPLMPAWLGDIIGGVLVVGAAFAPFPNAEFRPNDALSFAVVLAPVALLPLRRLWPLPVLAACLVLYAIAIFTGTLPPGVVLATAIAMFGVATRSGRRTTIIAASAAVLLLIVLSPFAAFGEALDPRTFQFAVTIAFAAALGDATRSRRAYIRAITERAERAEQSRESEARRRVSEERLRIARDLHDTVAHQISVISLNAGVASSSLESRPEKAKEALSTIRTAARTVLGEIGDLLEMLRADSDGASPAPAASPQPGLGQLDALIGQFADVGLVVGLRIEGDLDALPPAADVAAYRIIQEGLTNALKHGSENRAHVYLRSTPDTLTVIVTNPVGSVRPDGNAGDSNSGGHGLIGLGERVASVRGALETGWTSGGFRVAATLPLTQEGQQ